MYQSRIRKKEDQGKQGWGWWGLSVEGGKWGVSTLHQLSCSEQSVFAVASPRASRDPSVPYAIVDTMSSWRWSAGTFGSTEFISRMVRTSLLFLVISLTTLSRCSAPVLPYKNRTSVLGKFFFLFFSFSFTILQFLWNRYNYNWIKYRWIQILVW